MIDESKKPTPKSGPGAENKPPSPERLRVVIDAMVWASCLTTVRPDSITKSLVGAALGGMIQPWFPGELLSEFEETMATLGVDQEAIDSAMDRLLLFETTRPIRHQIMGCTDPGDDHLVELAVYERARFVVSDDERVNNPPSPLREYLAERKITPISPYNFMQAIRHHLALM